MTSEASYIVLEFPAHGGARNEDGLYGGWHRRYLNVTGRWSADGTRAIPLIAWPDTESAMDAARIATKARARVIEMGSIGGSALDPACFSAYNDTMVAALEGYLPASVAAARKLDAEREKLMRYAMAVLKTAAAAKDGPAATLEAERQANQEIRAYFGGGSVVSAAQYMTGKRATDLIARVLDGEIACDSDLSPERLVFAAVFSRAFVEGRA